MLVCVLVPPAGLEPAALCLASSIRLSLTARQSWGCWLDYILDVSVPTRIVSEDPFALTSKSFLRITQSSRIFTSTQEPLRSTGGSQGVPAYRVVHSMGSNIPHQGSNKADALSAELQGRQFQWLRHVTAGKRSGHPAVPQFITTHTTSD